VQVGLSENKTQVSRTKPKDSTHRFDLLLYVHACFGPLMRTRRYVCVQAHGCLWFVATKSTETFDFDVNFCGRTGLFPITLMSIVVVVRVYSPYVSRVPSTVNTEQRKLADLQ